ncbi:DUF1700 domain-containing protein [Enterococcus rivorum]|uniref:DUF1700 domain-containing protein n=2 Tax=Enterococcus rivorum TaxID=762845 RepID=A0A1E5KX32_9ENTE|nr:DUF1700 domain-containing protein [Enterococcus rivorum]MBP2097230.1 putative membrane protein [Enterococcus rivorum]OEH82416.1 hypothetical protein BCR26_03000 [Enterococcus rivorum]
MELEVKQYLSTVSTNLNYLSATERREILEEINSHIEESLANHQSVTEILKNLGDPVALAQAFAGNNLSTNQSFNMKHLLKLFSFYTKTGLSGMIVLPFLSILSITLYACAYFVVLMGLIVTIGTILGFSFPPVVFNLGFWAAPNILAFPITAIFGFLFYKLSKYLWHLMKQYISKVSSSHQLLQKK